MTLAFYGLFLGVSLLCGLISFWNLRNCLFLSDITCLFRAGGLLSLITLVLFFLAAQAYYHYQIIRCGLKLSNGETPLWTDLWTTGGMFGTFFHARLLYTLRIALWSLLLLIPGIYQATVYFFTGYSIVDSRARTVYEDQRIARSLSTGIRWQLLFLVLMSTLFTHSGVWLLILALEPIIVLAGVDAYKQQINALRNPSNEGIGSLPADKNQ